MSGVLVLVEPSPDGADRLSLEALTFAGTLVGAIGGPLEAVVIGPGAASAAASLGGVGLAVVHVVDDARLDAFAPEAWAATVVQLMRARSPAAVVAPGSDRGAEVLAHVGARTSLPMVANVVAAEGSGTDGRLRITRQRWAGSLLEDAWFDAPTRLMTVAAHAVPPVDVVAGAAVPSRRLRPRADRAGPARPGHGSPGTGRRRGRAGRCTGGRGRRPRPRQLGGLRLAR